jgi:hypothetical protein
MAVVLSVTVDVLLNLTKGTYATLGSSRKCPTLLATRTVFILFCVLLTMATPCLSDVWTLREFSVLHR